MQAKKGEDAKHKGIHKQGGIVESRTFFFIVMIRMGRKEGKILACSGMTLLTRAEQVIRCNGRIRVGGGENPVCTVTISATCHPRKPQTRYLTMKGISVSLKRLRMAGATLFDHA